MKKKAKRRPRPYQRVGVALIEKFKGRALVADEMGLGKTPQAIWWAKWFMKKGLVVVVCPKSIKLNWQDEILIYANKNSEVIERKSQHIPSPQLRRIAKKGLVFVLINYDITEAWTERIKDLKPKLIIIDEVQCIKNPGAKRTKAVREICEKCPHVVALGGTGGLEKVPIELFPILNILRPDKFPSRMRFGNRYCRPEYTNWGTKFTGGTRLDELNRRLKRYCMIRRKKIDVLKDLPAKSRIPVLLQLPDMRQYVAAEKDFIKWLTQTHPDRVSKARKAERLVRVMYLKRLVGELKKPVLKEWIEEFVADSGNKLLVFGVHKSVVGWLHETFPRSVRVDGSVTGRKRHEAFKRFNTKKSCRFLFANMKAAGVGWSCRSASDEAIVELGWTPGEHVQVEDRIHGIGRGVEGRKSTIYYLIARGTIEEKILAVIQARQIVLDAVLDGKKTADGFDVLDRLEEMLLGEI